MCPSLQTQCVTTSKLPAGREKGRKGRREGGREGGRERGREEKEERERKFLKRNFSGFYLGLFNVSEITEGTEGRPFP